MPHRLLRQERSQLNKPIKRKMTALSLKLLSLMTTIPVAPDTKILRLRLLSHFRKIVKKNSSCCSKSER